MSLYESWQTLVSSERGDNRFWDNYFDLEKELYRKLLSEHETVHRGEFSVLAEKFGWDETYFIGFIDGINTSLKQEYHLESINTDTDISLDIDFEKLYFNMLEAKAPWLYELSEWDDILSAEKRTTILKSWRTSKIFIRDKKVGANDPCPCGSGKKYKKCCGRSAD